VLFLVALGFLFWGATKDTKLRGAIAAAASALFVTIWSAGNPWLKVFDPEASFYQQLIEGIL